MSEDREIQRDAFISILGQGDFQRTRCGCDVSRQKKRNSCRIPVSTQTYITSWRTFQQRKSHLLERAKCSAIYNAYILIAASLLYLSNSFHIYIYICLTTMYLYTQFAAKMYTFARMSEHTLAFSVLHIFFSFQVFLKEARHHLGDVFSAPAKIRC